MNKFVRNLITEWRKLDLAFEDKTIIVAVSGGADSVSLALALHELEHRKKLRLHFVIAHFNHNLRGGESKRDAFFVKDLAQKLNFEFIVNTQHPKSKIQNQKGNLEQNARLVRYKFLSKAAEKYDAYAVLTAHSQNDQAETFLLNLIRGSGLAGLSGMKPVRGLEPGAVRAEAEAKTTPDTSKPAILLIRPLLNWAKREDTERFCLENGVDFCRDAMNDDLKFLRVRLRKEIIPLLKKINPKIIETLSQTANLLRDDAEELAKIDSILSEQLSQEELKKLSKPMRRKVLRDWLEHQRGDLKEIDLKHLDAIERLIFSPKSGRISQLPRGERVVKKRGNIFFEKTEVEKS